MADEGLSGGPPAAKGLPVQGGAFVAIVGRSGSGKDTLIDYARRRLAGESAAVFVRRVITRPSNAAFEDHDTATGAAFDAALAAGEFSLAWEAHGLKYGLPANVDRVLEEGRVAVANVSRGAISAARRRWRTVIVVEITAAPELLETRLASRGRESGGALRGRLAREIDALDLGDARRLDNSGPMAIAGDGLVDIIAGTIKAARAAGLVDAGSGETDPVPGPLPSLASRPMNAPVEAIRNNPRPENE